MILIEDFAGDENLGPLSLIRPRKMVLSLETPILDRKIENRCWDNDFVRASAS